MPLAVNDVVRIVVFQELFSQRLMNVLHYRVVVAADPGVTEAEELTELSLRVANTTLNPMLKWLPAVASELLFVSARAQKVYPTRGVYQQSPMVVEGTHVGTATTANVAASITKRSLRPLRKGVGHIQIGGIPQEGYAEGTLEPEYLGIVEDLKEVLAASIIVPGTSAEYRPCLWGGQVPTEDDDLWELVVQKEVRTMHRRTVRLGE